MATAILRTVILYMLLIAGLRLGGKRQIGEQEPIALVLTLPSARPTAGASPTSVAAAKALISGEAQTYHQQYTEILQTLRQPGEICEIPDDVVCPAFLNPLGLADEGQSDYWVNQALANYFGHQKVVKTEEKP